MRLLDALAVASAAPGETTRKPWLEECIRSGLVEAPQDGETRRERDAKLNRFRKAVAELREAGIIGLDGERVADLSQKYR